MEKLADPHNRSALSLVVCAGVIVALTGLNPIEVYKGILTVPLVPSAVHG